MMVASKIGYKSKLLFLICSLSVWSAFSQQIKVIDKSNLQPIELVSIYTADGSKSVQTDNQGKASLASFSEEDLLFFQHPTYYQFSISIKDLKEINFTVSLSERIIKIDEIVVSAHKWEENKNEISHQIINIDPKEIAFQNPQTSADVLAASGQVFVQKSQLGGGSPMIRGFAANRLLIVLDGVRINNAIFRGGNLQNVITLDPNVLEATEVVFGPGSVIYGSDALGGVMDFHTINSKFSNSKDPQFSVEAFTRYASANQGKTGHLHFNLGGKRLASVTGVSFSDFDDLVTGSKRTDEFPDFGKRPFFVERRGNTDTLVVNENENQQVFSGYSQFNLLQKFKFRTSDFSTIGYSFIYSTSSDIPRYDRLTEFENGVHESAEWFYGPQKFMMHSMEFNLVSTNRFFDQAKILTSIKTVEESRNDRKYQNDNRRTRTEKVDAYSLNIEFDKNFDSPHQLFYGAEAVYNQVESKAFSKNIITELRQPASTRYPDGGSDYYLFAAYISDKWKPSESIIISSGIRYNYFYLRSVFEDTTFFNFPYDEIKLNKGAFNGSLGMVYLPSKDWKLNLLFSTGFRAPNVDDVGKVFDSEPGTIIVPNPQLGPEFTYNGELGVQRNFADKLKLEGVIFYTMLDDVIVRSDFTFNGQDSMVFDGTLSKVQALVNAGDGYIFGYSLKAEVAFNKSWAARSTLTYTDGRDKTNDEPLRHTTPLFGQTSLLWNTDQVKAELFAKYNGKRAFEDLPPSEQNKPNLYTTDGSLAWFTLNLRGSYQLNPHLQITAALENIFDQHYRPYSSGISAPGRNFIFSIRANF